MNYSKIRQLQKMNKVSNREISVVVGLTDTGYGKMLENETCTVSTLEKIATYFKVPVSYFFDLEEKPQAYKPIETKVDVAEDGCPFCRLKDDVIASQKETIETQKETIAALKGEHKKETQPTSGKKAS
jgi:transcriptional regulator with XRE-family HTH domain